MPFDLRPIPGFEGHYSVTRDGRVWSHKWSGLLLKPMKNATGYLFVSLSMGGKPRHFLVHRLVALAWIPNSSPLTLVQVNHLNGIKTDNNDTNLEWCTGQHNVLHSFRNLGRVHSAAVRAQAKSMGTATRTLTPEQVRRARERSAGGESLTSIAASLPLSKGATHSLIHRRTYRDI